MRRTVNIILSGIAWCALLGYLVFATRACNREQKQTVLAGVDISVKESPEERIITPETVAEWLREDGFVFDGTEIENINTAAIRDSLLSRPFVGSARVYADMQGGLNIEVSQRRPVMRVMSAGGYDFYVSEDDWILPVRGSGSVHVPVVTGSIPLPFEAGFGGSIAALDTGRQLFSQESYLYLVKLINFVKSIGEDSFWNAQIVQINIADNGGRAALKNGMEPEIELVPRIGRHLIRFGTVDDAPAKLDKLMLFYGRVLDHRGWDAYRYIDLRFKDQIVCRR